MTIEKLPLSARLHCCASHCPAYPEYLASVICGFGEMPLSEYLSGVSPEKRQRVYSLLGIYREDPTYQWAALQVTRLPSPLALEVMRILAEPMIRYDELIRREEASAHG